MVAYVVSLSFVHLFRVDLFVVIRVSSKSLHPYCSIILSIVLSMLLLHFPLLSVSSPCLLSLFQCLMINVAIVCAVNLSRNSSMLLWNNPICIGLALSFNSFNFLASLLGFVFLVLSSCFTVFPCTSSLRSSHNCMKCLNVILTNAAPQTYPSLFFPTVLLLLLSWSFVHSCVILPAKKCLRELHSHI
jgi:hypothetical protein